MTPENITALINAMPALMTGLGVLLTALTGAFIALWSKINEVKKSTDGMHSELIRLTKLEERVNAGQLATNVDAAAARLQTTAAGAAAGVVTTATQAAHALAGSATVPAPAYDKTIKVERTERGVLLDGAVVDIEGATIKAKE